MKRLTQYVLALIACISSLSAKNNTFSIDRLTKFYDDFVYEEKQILDSVYLTEQTVFWVSQNGNDASLGTKQAPFLTLKRARDAVRALSSSAFEHQDVYVFIEEGTYRLSEPLVLDSRDSGQKGHNVVYSAAPESNPVISGAIQVTNWSLYDGSLGIYRAYVGSYKSRQLYVNGNRRDRAKTTSYPPGFLPNWTHGGIQFISTDLNPPAWKNPLSWTNPQNIEAVIMTQWKMMRVPLNSITNGLITLQQPAWNNANVYFDKETNKPGEWSFWQVTWFENAYEFLTSPGQWYLNESTGWLYYIPLEGEDLNSTNVELPILENLIVGQGTLEKSIHNIRFEGLTFSYATWLGSSSNEGYISDQSGQLLLGSNHLPNIIGHDQNVEPTPGNLEFTFAYDISFYGNIFEHLGAVGLHFGLGSKNNKIDSNLFTDISSSAIELGGVTAFDSHPSNANYILRNNLITNNLIKNVANEYVDAAGIFVGFSQKTTISYNTIYNVPWSGIAMGWGWGLLDVGSFPGLLNAYSGEWGTFDSPTPNYGCKILQNRIQNFLEKLWDGGAIYVTGQQGPSLSKGLLIEGNVASGKRSGAGGNTFYTDGGSRYVRLWSNASYDNVIGATFYGPAPQISDPFYLQYPLYYLQNGAPYGSDSGGCVTYGDIAYFGNYWLEAPIPTNIMSYNDFYHDLVGFYPYLGEGFCDVCYFMDNGITYPINLSFDKNLSISSMTDIPSSLLSNSGVQTRPVTIPTTRWVVPSL